MKITTKQLIKKREQLCEEEHDPLFPSDYPLYFKTKTYEELITELFCMVDILENKIKKLEKQIKEMNINGKETTFKS